MINFRWFIHVDFTTRLLALSTSILWWLLIHVLGVSFLMIFINNVWFIRIGFNFGQCQQWWPPTYIWDDLQKERFSQWLQIMEYWSFFRTESPGISGIVEFDIPHPQPWTQPFQHRVPGGRLPSNIFHSDGPRYMRIPSLTSKIQTQRTAAFLLEKKADPCHDGAQRLCKNKRPLPPEDFSCISYSRNLLRLYFALNGGPCFQDRKSVV